MFRSVEVCFEYVLIEGLCLQLPENFHRLFSQQVPQKRKKHKKHKKEGKEMMPENQGKRNHVTVVALHIYE